MIDRRTKNAEIFRDTERRYMTDQALVQAVRQSIESQVFIAEKTTVDVPAPSKTKKAMVIVSGKRSLEAAEHYAKQGKKVCVLNFASATNPGGGVVNGSSAQEECICRCTTLYPCLNTDQMWNVFYRPHRKAANPLYNIDCIYTPDVCVFKSDTNFPEPLSKEDWWSVNILTCAAPNLRERPSNAMNPHAGNTAAKITPSELEKLLTARIRRIFEIAVANENEVLILGAFGCGAFRNPPEIVARVFNKVMQDYLCYLDTIEYAVYTALLSKLSLAKDHRDNLRGRGLLDEEIDKLGYKTTPVAGMSMMAKQLRSDGYYLAGVPGFYRKENGDWTFINESRGILIPVRDQRGMIQGLQIRRDNTEKRKFRWVSSTDRKDGCKAEGWAHLSGTISEQMILTEGPMKADVIHALTGISVIAVPGVNTLTQLKVMLEALRDEGVVRIRTAFDMDFTTNYHVQNGFKNLLSLLDGMGFKFGTYVWDSRYKGLDDFIWESMMKKTRGGAGD